MADTPRISVIVVTRNAPRVATLCLGSLLACADALKQSGGVEFILADDCSAPGRDSLGLFSEFRQRCDHPVTALQFTRQQHYAGAVAYTMSIAKGDVLFISHDMILTPACVQEMIDVNEREREFGIFRPRSGHMDWALKMQLIPPTPISTIEQAATYGADIREKYKGQVTGWPAFIGDAMYIRRDVIDKIGVFDTRFFGFWSDIDYGIRVQRAGWRHGIAMGAWLYHFGKAAGLEPEATGGEAVAQKASLTSIEADAAYAVFREKWSTSLPDKQDDFMTQQCQDLRAGPPPQGGEFQPRLTITPDVAKFL